MGNGRLQEGLRRRGGIRVVFLEKGVEQQDRRLLLLFRGLAREGLLRFVDGEFLRGQMLFFFRPAFEEVTPFVEGFQGVDFRDGRRVRGHAEDLA